MSREWSQDELSTLRTMWDNGASASQIARKLPADRTRSAVLGKVFRLKLLARPQAIVKKSKPQAHDPGLMRIVATRAKKTEDVVAIDDPGPMNPPITVMTVTDQHCRWSYDAPGGGDYYCGQPPKPGTSWCEHHHRKVYQPKRVAA